MLKFINTVIILMFSFSLIAQKNLVPNGGFDAPGKKIKSAGMIELAEGWSSPHDLKADLYSTECKDPNYNAPDNVYGRETPEQGENYAGFMAYSYKDAKPRTYLQTELTSPLEKDRVYCVKYLISMADLAKYASNNIGLYLANEKTTANQIDKFEIKPQIMHSQNKVQQEQYFWTPICRTYVAKGGEKFITIGNFAKFDDIEAVKLKRPSGFSKPQQTIGYYYVDMVSVIPMDSLREDACICEKDAGIKKMNVVYNENISAEHRLEDEHLIEFIELHFDSKSATLSEDSKKDLDKIYDIMVEEVEFIVDIHGHSDEIEGSKDNGALSANRAKAAKDYLVAKGISEERLKITDKKSAVLNNSDGTQSGQAKNRRVTFDVE